MTVDSDDSPTETETARAGLGRRASAALLARPRPLHVVLLVICFVLGIALVTQVRAQQTDPLDRMSQEDLVLLLDSLSTREQTLRSEKADLQIQLDELRSAVSQQQAAQQAADKARVQAQINSGSVAVHGEGLTMTVVDPDHVLPSSQFVMALGELRNAGAEAMAVNGVRLTTRSWFALGDRGMVVDGQTITSPYSWQVIGDSDTIVTALEIQAGAAQQMRALGADVTLSKAPDVVIDAVATVAQPQWASVQ